MEQFTSVKINDCFLIKELKQASGVKYARSMMPSLK